MRPRRVSQIHTDIMHGYVPQVYIHDNPWRTHKKRKKAGKKHILLLLIMTYNDRGARGEQCYVVCNPLL